MSLNNSRSTEKKRSFVCLVCSNSLIYKHVSHLISFLGLGARAGFGATVGGTVDRLGD